MAKISRRVTLRKNTLICLKVPYYEKHILEVVRKLQWNKKHFIWYIEACKHPHTFGWIPLLLTNIEKYGIICKKLAQHVEAFVKLLFNMHIHVNVFIGYNLLCKDFFMKSFQSIQTLKWAHGVCFV